MDAALAPTPPAGEAATAAAPAPAPLVRAHALTLVNGGRLIQQGLSFDIVAGEVLVIAGGSGCGKSTLLRHLVGLQRPAAGRVEVAGDGPAPGGGDGPAAALQDLYALDDADPAAAAALRRRFGVTFQAGALWSSMTVGENVMLPLQMFTPLPAAAREREARFRLALVGLPDSFDAEPAALSGGMRKRAAIARALALDPPLLFLDEPSAGLDPIASRHLDALLLQLRQTLGTTVVMVSHELDSIFAVADRVLFLDAAERTMTALGAPRELAARGPATVRAFLQRGDEHGAGEARDGPAARGAAP